LEATMNKSSAKGRSSTNGKEPLAGGDTNRKPGVVPLPSGKPGQTTPSRGEERVPRLPHEHDESADSQVGKAADSPGAERSRQAFEDVERGLVDTDRGLEGDTLVHGAPSSGKKRRNKTPL
jgi:hypothetical protein